MLGIHIYILTQGGVACPDLTVFTSPNTSYISAWVKSLFDYSMAWLSTLKSRSYWHGAPRSHVACYWVGHSDVIWYLVWYVIMRSVEWNMTDSKVVVRVPLEHYEKKGLKKKGLQLPVKLAVWKEKELLWQHSLGTLILKDKPMLGDLLISNDVLVKLNTYFST